MYTINCFHKDDKLADARLELDAACWAIAFMKERKITIPSTLAKFVEDRKEFYNEILGIKTEE